MRPETGLRIAAVVLGVFAFIFAACMSGGNGWVVSCMSNMDAYSGLWQACVGDTCHDIEKPKGYITIVRAMTIMCTLMSGAGLMLSVLVLFSCFERLKVFDLMQFLLYLTAAIFASCGLTIYNAEEEFTANNFHYGWTFNMGWVSFLFCSLAYVVTLLLFLQEEKVGYINHPVTLVATNHAQKDDDRKPLQTDESPVTTINVEEGNIHDESDPTKN